jgi:hypothetical protein
MEPLYVAAWPDDVFETIAKAVRADRARYASGRLGRRKPSATESEQIRALALAAIRASLEVDEGRPANFSLVLCEQEPAASVIFSEARAFDEDSVRQLMPLIDPEIEGIAVEWTNEGPKIWGITARREDAVVIRAIAPGRVSVCFGGATIARFSGDECRILAIDQKNMLLWASGLLSEERDSWAFVKIQFLWTLGLVARTLGHGATFVIADDEAQRAMHGGWELRSPYVELSNLVLPACADMERLVLEQPDENPLVLLDHAKGLGFLQTGGLPGGDEGDVIRRVAMWTQIDGAVVLNHDFAALGMGAKLTFDEPVAKWHEWRPTAPEWISKEGRDGEFSGTRHASAIRFVASQKESAALVCSQDGSLTLIGRLPLEQGVAVMRNLELVMA